jgi:hypothetical protein
MAKTWLRIIDRNIELDVSNPVDFFTPLQRLKAFGDTYVLTRNNANTQDYFPNPDMEGVDYDFGMMALPSGAKRLWYHLDNNGLLSADGFDINGNSATLTDDFMGMVLSDVQPTGQVSPFFAGAMGLNINLCKDYNWDIEPSWGRYQHQCAGKFTNSVNGVTPLTAETPIFWIGESLRGDEGTDHPGYYLVPFLFPEKIVAYYAVKADEGAYQRLNSVWFERSAYFMANYQTQIDPFIAVEVSDSALRRSDDFVFHYVMESDDPATPTIALACVSKQGNEILVF